MDTETQNASQAKLPDHKYYGQYPRRHLRNIIKSFIGFIIALSIFGGLTVAAFCGSVDDCQNGLTGICAFTGAIFLFILFIAISFVRKRHVVSILPYFSAQVGGVHTFASGALVASNCKTLDSIASEHGVKPIPAFGFKDDMSREKLEWHDPADGLLTINAILDHLITSIPTADEKLMEQLRKIQDALTKAKTKGVKFCFLLREGDGTCQMEHDQRKGTFF